MSERRRLRLIGLWLILVGVGGIMAALAGRIGHEGALAFPASVAIGIIVIVANRPANARKPGRRRSMT